MTPKSKKQAKIRSRRAQKAPRISA